LPAGGLRIYAEGGLVKANRRLTCWANGLRLNSSSTSVGTELSVTVTTSRHTRVQSMVTAGRSEFRP
jgi:hypothetical protein